jgi:hypothetical protein
VSVAVQAATNSITAISPPINSLIFIYCLPFYWNLISYSWAHRKYFAALVATRGWMPSTRGSVGTRKRGQAQKLSAGSSEQICRDVLRFA